MRICKSLCIGLVLSCGVLFLVAFSTTEPRGISWRWGPVMPLAKSCRATTGAGRNIVTVGGTWWERSPADKKTKHWSASAFLLDTERLKWRALPDYPLQVGYAFAAQVNNQIYVIGGRSEERGNAETFVLDLSTNDEKWRSGPSLPRPRWGLGGGVIDGVIYIAGGSEGDPSKNGKSRLATTVLAFDPRQPDRGWTQIASLPDSGTEWRMSAAADGKLYLMGGLVSSSDSDKGFLPQTTAMALDVERATWKQLRPLPVPMGSGAAVAIGAKSILMTGGFGLAATAASAPDHKARTYFTADCLLYDIANDSYRFLTPMKMPLTDQGFVYVNRKPFVIGGEDAPYQTRTDLVQIGAMF